jgi:xanthine dehydrogenase FAD-binding subunit
MVKTYIPGSLAEALTIRQQAQAFLLAGGTDLMVKYRSGQGVLPRFTGQVLFIGHLDSLRNIVLVNNKLRIGAACTLSELLANNKIPELLKQAVGVMASPAVRNRGTIGGNICNASPAGDTLPPLYALGASVVLESIEGQREILVQDFILGPGKIDLSPQEILTAIQIPLVEHNVFFYRKVGTRKADALAKLSFAGLAAVSSDRIADIKLAFGAVGPTVIQDRQLEKKMIGRSLTDRLHWLAEVKGSYAALLKPIDDQRSSARYRKMVSLNLLEHFLLECIL